MCRFFLRLFSCWLFLPILIACSSQGYNISQLAKTDINMASDVVLDEMRSELKLLMTKLYRRNPSQLTLSPIKQWTVEERINMIFDQPDRLIFSELNDKQELDSMNLAFDESFQGDRVFALMVGLVGMLRQSYNYDTDFYFHEELDPQKLYNSARNIEVMAWKLKNNKNRSGQPFLITSTVNGVIDNVSFERTYGKLINTQDLMAKIIADHDSRTINTVIKGTLSVFLPI